MNIEKLEEAKKLGEALEHIVQFSTFYNRGRDAVIPRKFLLKNILGFSDEECEEIEKEIIEEVAYKKYVNKQIEARVRQMEVDGDFKADTICDETEEYYGTAVSEIGRAKYALSSR